MAGYYAGMWLAFWLVVSSIERAPGWWRELRRRRCERAYVERLEMKEWIRKNEEAIIGPMPVTEGYIAATTETLPIEADTIAATCPRCAGVLNAWKCLECDWRIGDGLNG